VLYPQLWKEHAREFIGETKWLGKDVICVNYNRWACDEKYRRSISEQLGVEFTDAGRETVRSLGSGSSFDGTAFDGRASEMDICNRWKQVQDGLRDVLMELPDPEVLHLAQFIWGPIETDISPMFEEERYDRLIGRMNELVRQGEESGDYSREDVCRMLGQIRDRVHANS